MEVGRVGVTLTDQNFQTMVLESPQPVLVAFWAEGCGP
jgi:thioredoxin-like negative regulator of GroEL